MRKIFTVLVVTLVCVGWVFQANAFAAMSEDEFFGLCLQGSSQQIVDAINNGANINARIGGIGETYATPLMGAIGNTEAVKTLLEHGADVSLMDDSGKTALDIAKLLEAESQEYFRETGIRTVAYEKFPEIRRMLEAAATSQGGQAVTTRGRIEPNKTSWWTRLWPNPKRRAIIGTWVGYYGNEITFSRNGTYVQVIPPHIGGRTSNGIFSVTGNRVTVTIPNLGNLIVIAEFEINGNGNENELILRSVEVDESNNVTWRGGSVRAYRKK